MAGGDSGLPRGASARNRGENVCNNYETVLDFARSVLKLALLDSPKTYHI